MIRDLRTKRFLIFSLLLLIPLLAHSAPEWQIIPSESQLTFTGIQNDAPVSGEFKKFTGKILFDPNNLKNSYVDIVVDINSLSVSYAQIKDTLLTPAWLNAKRFPKAEFKSNLIKKTGEKTYLTKGTLTIRDKTVPVALTFAAEQVNANKIIVTGNTMIKRTQFDIGQGEWASTNEIKDDVTIHYKIVAVKR